MKKTIEVLTKSFVGESMARNRYSFYASIARKEGFEQIAEIFDLTANQEKEHAKQFFTHLQEFKKKFPMDLTTMIIGKEMVNIGKTKDNLRYAAGGEHHEYTFLYPQFAKIASREGFKKIAARFRAIMVAEKHHEERYKKLLKEMEAGAIFKKKKAIEWTCRECGYAHYGKTPPDKCPSCDHEESFYQVKCEKY